MPRKSLDKEKIQSELLIYLRQHGVSAAPLLRQIFKISQPTLSRMITSMKDKLLIIGKAQETKYAVRRAINQVATPIPLYEILENGSSRQLGVLHAHFPDGFYFESNVLPEIASALYPDLPYFLNDLRPTGFLGRLVPEQNTDLNLPSDIRLWTTDHCLIFLTARAWNTVGNFILGDKAFQIYIENYQQTKRGVEYKEREKTYLQYASDVLAIGDVGSSAAGEQPKFMTTIQPENRQVIVKFSPTMDTEVGRRVADLLICEHIALQVLKKYSQEVAESTILVCENKLFFEVQRFDRDNTFARHGLISLGSLDAEFTGVSGSWSQTSKELIKQKILPQSFYKSIRWRELFGNLIGNTDMHLYNLSFFTKGLRVIALAPVYDMLPMLFMPRNNQIIQKEFMPPLPLPEDGDIWSLVYSAANDFWHEVLKDRRISAEFKKIAQQCLDKLITLQKITDLLPKK